MCVHKHLCAFVSVCISACKECVLYGVCNGGGGVVGSMFAEGLIEQGVGGEVWWALRRYYGNASCALKEHNR